MPKEFNVVKMNGKLYYTFLYSSTVVNYDNPYDVDKVYDRTFITLKIPTTKKLDESLINEIITACSYDEFEINKLKQKNIEIEFNSKTDSIESRSSHELDIKDKDKSYLDRSASLYRYDELPSIFDDLAKETSGEIKGGRENLIADILNMHNAKYINESSEKSMSLARKYIQSMNEYELLRYLNKPFVDTGLSVEEKYELFEELYLAVAKNKSSSTEKVGHDINKPIEELKIFLSADDGKSIERFNALYALNKSGKYKKFILDSDMINFALNYLDKLNPEKNQGKIDKLTGYLKDKICIDNLNAEKTGLQDQIKSLNERIQSNNFKSKVASRVAIGLAVVAIVCFSLTPLGNVLLLAGVIGGAVAAILAFAGSLKASFYKEYADRGKNAVISKETKAKELDKSIKTIKDLKTNIKKPITHTNKKLFKQKKSIAKKTAIQNNITEPLNLGATPQLENVKPLANNENVKLPEEPKKLSVKDLAKQFERKTSNISKKKT